MYEAFICKIYISKNIDARNVSELSKVESLCHHRILFIELRILLTMLFSQGHKISTITMKNSESSNSLRQTTCTKKLTKLIVKNIFLRCVHALIEYFIYSYQFLHLILAAFNSLCNLLRSN